MSNCCKGYLLFVSWTFRGLVFFLHCVVGSFQFNTVEWFSLKGSHLKKYKLSAAENTNMCWLLEANIQVYVFVKKYFFLTIHL